MSASNLRDGCVHKLAVLRPRHLTGNQNGLAPEVGELTHRRAYLSVGIAQIFVVAPSLSGTAIKRSSVDRRVTWGQSGIREAEYGEAPAPASPSGGLALRISLADAGLRERRRAFARRDDTIGTAASQRTWDAVAADRLGPYRCRTPAGE